eukprot:scaffold2069_cov187-Amphora_coffeaeformis.AAC.6
MDWLSFLVLQVCPSVGCFLATLCFCAPLRDLNQGLQKGSLSTLNPVPWAVAVGNTFGWLLYGFILKDFFVLAANLPGLFINLFLCFGAAKLQYYQRQRNSVAFDTARVRSGDDQSTMSASLGKQMDLMLSLTSVEQTLSAIAGAWAILGSYCGWFTTEEHAKSIIGVTVNCNLVFFYAAPLSTIWKVIKTGNSVSIHRPTMFMNTANASFWVVYGTAIQDRIILFPNVVGALLGLLQIIICVLYPHMPLEEDGAFDGNGPIVNYDLMDDASRSS